MVRPFGNAFHWASVLIVYNAFALALFSIITRKLAGKERIATQQFYLGFIGSVVLLPFAIASWEAPATGWDWVWFLCLGIWAWIGHEMMVRAHGLAPASLLLPFKSGISSTSLPLRPKRKSCPSRVNRRSSPSCRRRSPH